VCVERLFLGTGPRPISFKFKFKYVCLVFIFKVTEPSPLQDSSGVRQKGGTPACAIRAYPDPPPLSPSSRIPRCPGGLCRGSIARVGSGPNCVTNTSQKSSVEHMYIHIYRHINILCTYVHIKFMMTPFLSALISQILDLIVERLLLRCAALLVLKCSETPPTTISGALCNCAP